MVITGTLLQNAMFDDKSDCCFMKIAIFAKLSKIVKIEIKKHEI